jgi:hypothetical protein
MERMERMAARPAGDTTDKNAMRIARDAGTAAESGQKRRSGVVTP